MSQQKRQHGVITGGQVWVLIALSLGLACSAQRAAAKECQRETPLPADVRLVTPGPEVPDAVARFASLWVGKWDKTDGFCQTLVVEEVLANGDARVISSTGSSVALNMKLSGFLHVTGRIVDGVLRFRGPQPDRPEFAYQVVDETLLGTLRGQGHVVCLG